ncbi:MAG: hypothetical protein JWQ30_1031, partial [Sediminibacterium sp.]|nr:hypothetical protein [Sediminibacterium sp.]
FVQAQDTTNVTLTDSARMYVYKNVYAVINNVSVQAPGSIRFGNFMLVGQTVDTTKWITSITVKVFASKTDALSGKPELFTKYLATLYTDKFPTQKDIMDRMRLAIK